VRGQAPDQRAEQRVAAEAAVKLGDVVVDAEREAHPLDRQPQLRLAGRPRLPTQRQRHRPRVERLGPQLQPPRPGFPGPEQDRAALDVEQAGRDPPADPQGAIGAPPPQPVGRGGPDLQLHG